MNKNYIKKEFNNSIDAHELMINDELLINKMEDIANLMINSINNGGKIIFAGNGGSAADSQHLAAELVSRFYFDRDAISSIALTTDTSILTAIGNDYGFEEIYRRQLKAIGNDRDVFVAITTSGNSLNLINALDYANSVGIKTVCLTGKKGGQISQLNKANIIINVPSNDTPRIQECHILIGHTLCAIIENELFK